MNVFYLKLILTIVMDCVEDELTLEARLVWEGSLLSQNNLNMKLKEAWLNTSLKPAFVFLLN